LDGGITNQKSKTFNMRKISGLITNVPPPSISRDKFGMGIIAPLGTPIEGVKVTDGEKVTFSDKDGKYEIETSKPNVQITKEGYAPYTIDTSIYAEGSTNSRIIVLDRYKGTEEKNIAGITKSRFFIGLGIVILFGVGLMVVIPKLKNK
jgi:hypothetical protein